MRACHCVGRPAVARGDKGAPAGASLVCCLSLLRLLVGGCGVSVTMSGEGGGRDAAVQFWKAFDFDELKVKLDRSEMELEENKAKSVSINRLINQRVRARADHRWALLNSTACRTKEISC